MKFTLEIELGNDAMRTRVDVERALYYAFPSTFNGIPRMFEAGESAPILDTNGAHVGKWEVTDDNSAVEAFKKTHTIPWQ